MKDPNPGALAQTKVVPDTPAIGSNTQTTVKRPNAKHAYQSIYQEVLKHAVRDAWNYNNELSYQRQ